MKQSLVVDTESLVQRYLSGESLNALATVFGISRTAVRARLVQARVVFRSRPAPPNTSKPEHDQLPAMYAAGMSMHEIGKVVGLSVGAVQSALRARHVQFRSVSEALALKYPNRRRGVLAANWKGGRRAVDHGKRGEPDDIYIYIHQPDHPYATKGGYVMEHRLVVEKRLGRYLEPAEVVHHLNGKKQDNRDENLELHDRGSHLRTHFKAIGSLDDARRKLAAYEARFGPLTDE